MQDIIITRWLYDYNDASLPAVMLTIIVRTAVRILLSKVSTSYWTQSGKEPKSNEANISNMTMHCLCDAVLSFSSIWTSVTMFLA